ncbi:MAG: tyrosine-protein phosphatase [Spirochaetes bacterium]|nr:tyrosine-protein phosphatase [Spirochaetota bacterium]
MKQRIIRYPGIAALLAATLLLPGCTTGRNQGARPDDWAQPVTRPGAPNLFRVSETFYRGAQPSTEGMRELKRLGITTVINLRANHSDRQALGDTGLRYIYLPMTAWNPEYRDVIRFLKVVTDPVNQPVFLHCMHGADRTGMLTAVYRMTVMGWPREKAISEMKEGGFGYHSVWNSSLIPFLEKIDIDKTKEDAGLR